MGSFVDEEMVEHVKVPNERINVLIGRNGKTKKRIEKEMHVKLYIDSSGKVEIVGASQDVFFAKDVVKAIARGFSPDNALKLKKDDYCFELINLKEVCRGRNDLIRIRARLIGEKGSIKIAIENATDSIISIYGSTVGIIAPIQTIHFAKHLIERIIDGARLSSVLHEAAEIKKRIAFERFLGK
jgi:ribosomal RNA assembly protein